MDAAAARRAHVRAEVAAHVAAWNAAPAWQRAGLLRSALPVEAASFVAHSNALEGVVTLSAGDTLDMVQQSAASARDPEAERAALNTRAPSASSAPRPAVLLTSSCGKCRRRSPSIAHSWRAFTPARAACAPVTLGLGTATHCTHPLQPSAQRCGAFLTSPSVVHFASRARPWGWEPPRRRHSGESLRSPPVVTVSGGGAL